MSLEEVPENYIKSRRPRCFQLKHLLRWARRKLAILNPKVHGLIHNV